MARIGYFLSSEEQVPQELVRQATLAEESGFQGLWISDHYHPWNDQQGQSPFVWTVIGALAQATRLPITTAVTCPTVRIHPAVIAQAAATAQVISGGRFALGVGSGEALNEHIFGDPWPPADTRLAMLEEAMALIAELWEGGFVNHEGEYYTVENARIYTLPDVPPPVYVSAFGRKSAELAGRIGDGLLSVKPDADLIEQFHAAGGHGKPALGGYKVCWGQDKDEARRLAYRLWPNDQLPGELPQVLPSPRHFEQASELVTEQMVGDAVVCGDDPDEHIAALRAYLDAGYDEVYINNIGPTREGFFRFYAKEVLPQVST
ncbi:MAG: TIGR03557 family F420-dependent LLM class oxidoreductase [Mycobacteriales bacterium]